MNSINQNQPEDNREDLSGAAAVEKIRAMVKASSVCFLCTAAATGDTGGARPMSVQQVDDAGNLWFLVAADSHTVRELAADPAVRLYFQGSAHADFMHLSGRGTVSRDRKKIDELWEPIVNTWFTGGKDDPRVRVIRVEPERGYYWDTKHGKAVAMVKMMIGAALRTTLDDSVEGTLSV